MPPTPAALDPFAALAEPRRREVLKALISGEKPVNDLVEALGWPQPQVSKHLATLRDAGIVAVRREGRHRIYRVNGPQLKPVHDWLKTFERFWDTHLARIKQRAEAAAKRPPTPKSHHPKEG